MKTHLPKVNLDQRKWHVIDAKGAVLGRLAAQAANILRGKNKPIYTPHLDAGDFVVVINAEKVKVTGKKMEEKVYYSHSQYPGGIKAEVLKDLLVREPEEAIRRAVWGMIPKNKLGRRVFKKLKVYCGPQHPHEAQNPQEYRF